MIPPAPFPNSLVRAAEFDVRTEVRGSRYHPARRCRTDDLCIPVEAPDHLYTHFNAASTVRFPIDRDIMTVGAKPRLLPHKSLRIRKQLPDFLRDHPERSPLRRRCNRLFRDRFHRDVVILHAARPVCKNVFSACAV